MRLETEDLIAAFRQEGTYETCGRFSIDLNAAAPKLRSYQLQDPFQYVLKLVQAGIAAGAKDLALCSSPRRVEFLIQEVTFPFESLRNLLAYLLSEPGGELERSLRHLATAVNSAVGIRAEEICLACWDGQQGIEVLWRPKNSLVRPILRPQQRGKYTRFFLKRMAGDFQKEIWSQLAVRDLEAMLRGQRKGMDSEQSWVYDRCHYAPAQITLNGRRLPGYSLGAPKWGSNLLSQLPMALAWMAGSRQLLPDYHLTQNYLPRSGPGGLAAPRRVHAAHIRGSRRGATYERILTLAADVSGPFQVACVQDGVLIQQLTLAWTGPGATVLTCADELDKDLTGMKIVENEANLTIFQTYAEELLKMGRKVLESRKRYPELLIDTLEEKLDLGEATPLRYLLQA